MMNEVNKDTRKYIVVTGAKEHNLKNINVTIPKNKLVVVTGISGSGKSSLAFDTIYAEGQRLYMESLSSYAKQFLQIQKKPSVTSIEGLSPSIAIDQKSISRNPRSTVGTITEINDYLRLLYSSIGIPFSPVTNKPIVSHTISKMLETVLNLPKGCKISILAPIKMQVDDIFKKVLEMKNKGFEKIIINEKEYEIELKDFVLDKKRNYDIKILIDSCKVDKENSTRIIESLESCTAITDGIVQIKIDSLPKIKSEQFKEGDIIFLSEKYSCPISGFQAPKIESKLFSFNSPYGACTKCQGIGKVIDFSPELIVPNKSLSINQGAIKIWQQQNISLLVKQTLESLAEHYKFSLDIPFESIPEKIQNILFYGSEEEINFSYVINAKKSITKNKFKGIINYLNEQEKKLSSKKTNQISDYQTYVKCTSCDGYKLKKDTFYIKINKLHIGQVFDMNIKKCLTWITNLPQYLTKQENKIVRILIKDICSRLKFLCNVGLDYLTLSRNSNTLSGGEIQRIRLTSQISSGLTNIIYVLDEPSIGLHQSDNQKLIQSLLQLKELGNTVILVEHDEETIEHADYIIDIGPKAGEYGGNLVECGDINKIILNKKSLTGAYLSGRKSINVNKKSKTYTEFLEIHGVNKNNLHNVDIKIPIGSFCAVTGVSGSGKSSLIIDTLYPAVKKSLDPNSNTIAKGFTSIIGTQNFNHVVEISQSPIGRTPRSNPATYIGLFNLIRDIFANLPESKIRGYNPSRFSFNIKGGRCEECKGDGLIKIEMHFLQDIYVTCDACNGTRYNKETLELKYRNKNINDILNMTVDESLKFFSHIESISEKIKVLQDIGLNYLKLGQSSTTLSGGESQRIKLSKELIKKSIGKTLYILDEPTTGLHFEDINNLVKILYELINLGNTIIVIEHNMDIIKLAEYIIDIGPLGGNSGGKVIFQGSIKDIINNKQSITGKFLKKKIEFDLQKKKMINKNG